MLTTKLLKGESFCSFHGFSINPFPYQFQYVNAVSVLILVFSLESFIDYCINIGDTCSTEALNCNTTKWLTYVQTLIITLPKNIPIKLFKLLHEHMW